MLKKYHKIKAVSFFIYLNQLLSIVTSKHNNLLHEIIKTLLYFLVFLIFFSINYLHATGNNSNGTQNTTNITLQSHTKT